MALDAWPASSSVPADTSRPAAGSAWTATIAGSPTGDGVEVILPHFSATQRWGPCPWQPRGTAQPQAGDRALVVFADDGATPWVVQWGDVGDDAYPTTPGPAGPAGVGTPDYDSGWYGEEANTTHITTKTHGLALTKPPRLVQAWFAPDLTPTRMEPIFLPGMALDDTANASTPYRNPGRMTFKTNTIEIGIYGAIPLQSVYDGTWQYWQTGYHRIYVWK
jgi:hypothetical protein